MSAPLRIGGFVAVLAAVLVAAFGVGRAVGTTARQPAEHVAPTPDAPTPDAPAGDAPTGDAPAGDAPAEPGALAVAAKGYRLVLDTAIRAPGRTAVAFVVLGPDATAVTAFDRVHDKDLHLIAVRRDLTGYQHLHPVMDDAGTWRTNVDLTPGTWRLIADFRPAGLGDDVALGVDLAVPGPFVPQVLPGVDPVARVDGYTVTAAADLVAGTTGEVTVTITQGDRPVTDLEPYLSAYGHLVAIRAGDVGYLHVHPVPGAAGHERGPTIGFAVAVPSAGQYRLFVDFAHGGRVHTAAFTVAVPSTAMPTATPTATPPPSSPGSNDEHTH